MSWEEERYDAAPGQPKFTHAHVVHELTGAIDGEVSICYLMVYVPMTRRAVRRARDGDGRDRRTYGQLRHAGRRHVRERRREGRWTILPGLRSGALRDIRGEGHFAAGD